MLIPSALDAVLWFDCPIKESLRRAIGRRVEQGEGDSSVIGNQIYHVEDVMPPTNQAPLCERLEQLLEDKNSVASLTDRFVSYD